MRIGPLFIGSEPTNMPGTRLVASWTTPSGYWRWAIWRKPYRYWIPQICPGYAGGHYCPGGGRLRHPFSVTVFVPWIGRFHFDTQPAMEIQKTGESNNA